MAKAFTGIGPISTGESPMGNDTSNSLWDVIGEGTKNNLLKNGPKNILEMRVSEYKDWKGIFYSTFIEPYHEISFTEFNGLVYELYEKDYEQVGQRYVRKVKVITWEELPDSVKQTIINDAKYNIKSLDAVNYDKWKDLVISSYTDAKGLSKDELNKALYEAVEKNYKLVDGNYVEKTKEDSNTNAGTIVGPWNPPDSNTDTSDTTDNTNGESPIGNDNPEDKPKTKPKDKTKGGTSECNEDDPCFIKFKEELKSSCKDFKFDSSCFGDESGGGGTPSVGIEAITKGHISSRDIETGRKQYFWEGEGNFDKIMEAFDGNIKCQYDSGRIVGNDYAKSYTSLLQAAMAQAADLSFRNQELKMKSLEMCLNAKVTCAKMDLEITKLYLEKEKMKLEKEKMEAELSLLALKQENIIAHTKLYDRQRLGFDDNNDRQLLKVIVDGYAMMFSSGLLNDYDKLPDWMDQDKMSQIWSDVKSNTEYRSKNTNYPVEKRIEDRPAYEPKIKLNGSDV
ncbi:MAG: hypothetical protein KGV46_01595 [Pasteurella sp.]|nr:hypothetical protein [Pasteurella sp.]